MFMVKIQEAAKAIGLPLKFVKTAAEARLASASSPSLILFDLNLPGDELLPLISSLKSRENTKSIHLVGFISHVQTDARAAAQAAGCDLVVARSVFSQQLPAILAKYGQGASV
jgi:CheY-like chemotaxis protein